MEYQAHQIIKKQQVASDIIIFTTTTKTHTAFKPGQFVYLRNPKWHDPKEPHPYSLASSPTDTTYELCVRGVGDWSNEMVKSSIGDIINVSEPQGSFVWDESVSTAVFLLGGVGISPIMAMLRSMHKNHTNRLTLLYGNRTPDTVVYREELEKMKESLGLKVVYIYSDLPKNHSWTGYTGFFTKDIIERESNLNNNPVFFVVGPPVFITHIQAIMDELGIPKEQLRTEHLEKNSYMRLF